MVKSNVHDFETSVFFKENFFRGLLVGDKSGDVFLFNTEGEKEGQLLLGET